MRSSPINAWLLARSGPLGWILAAASLIAGLYVLVTGPSLRSLDVRVQPIPHAEAAAMRIVGPQACAECHVDEYLVWQESAHQTRSRALTRLDRAKEIASKLGVRRIKAEERCTSCHYTVQGRTDGRLRAISGVSCESCHGAAVGWIDAHADFGPDCENAREETPEHRGERYARVDAEGMLRPDSMHALATRCFDCHAITDGELVEVGGHPAGDGFELVAWSQGEMRHNFVHEDGTSTGNAEASPARQAALYVIGRGLQLEYALRALVEARNDASVARVQRALDELRAIADRLPDPSVQALLLRMQGVDLSIELPSTLVDEIAGLVQALDGLAPPPDQLADLLPSTDEYRGEPRR